MTETARPSSFEPEVPPRNDGIPETSISGTQQQQTWPPSTPWQQRKDSGAAVAETEGEAQKSKPMESTSTLAGTASQTATSSTTKPATPRKSKLRARKAPIKLTPVAVSQLRNLFEQPESKYIRIGVKNRGCSGLAYHLEYVDKPGAFDETVEQDGVKVLIDSKALFSIIGSEMDWQEDKLSARFVFRNPNISESSDNVSIASHEAILTLRYSRGVRLRRILLYFMTKLNLDIESCMQGRSIDSPIEALTPSKLPRLIVHYPHILNHIRQTRHKLQMRRVLLQIVLPILLALKFGHKAMCERTL